SRIAHGNHYKGFYISHDAEFQGKIVEESGNEEVYVPLDFSITKNVAAMIFAAIFLTLIFVRMGRIYRKEKLIVPNGLNGFLEPMIMFIRNEIAIPNIGKEKYDRFMPYLLTVFFFILINNLMGLAPPFIPFGANVTGNIAVTFVLAAITFLITQAGGTKTYWKHIFATPGVPFWLIPIMIPVELIGLFIKPFALMIRLFANITAGHIIILSLVSVIFIFKSLAVAPVSVAFVLFMSILEILVAFLQAYVFTLLSALFIGLAVKQDHH
ncbi:MAG: F0F1 ATP synthase subunit A, partial [Bacteroidales bacterium]|nr:F0F1 ATP synthase subunit A [Bacteroidales bacterium]